MIEWHELQPEQRAEVRRDIRDEMRFWKDERNQGSSDFAPWFYDALNAALQRLKKVKRANEAPR